MAGKIEGIDSMAVVECEIVPDGTTARMIASGSGRPPIVLDFGRQLVFEAAGKMLAACDKIDHGQMVAILRVLAERMGASAPGAFPLVPVAQASPALPVQAAQSSPPSDLPSDPLAAMIVDRSAAFRDRASEAVGALVRLGEVMLAVAAHSSGSPAALECSPPPPWRVDIAGGGFDVDVDVERGAVVFLAEDPTATMTVAESDTLGAILRVASARLASPVASVASLGKKSG